MPALFPFIGRTPLFFFEPDTGDNPSGTSSPEDDPEEPRERTRPTDILDRHGRDALRLAEKLADAQNDTFSLREKNRRLREETAALRGRVPADGSVVLSAEDAAAWKAYQELGKAEDLKKRLTDSEGATTELTKLRRDAVIRDVADVAKFRASVLADRAQGLDLAVREVEENGKKVKRAVVVTDGKDTPLDAYAKEHWADYLPALQLGEQRAGGTHTPSGTPFPRQHGAGDAPTDNPARAYLQKAYKRPKA